MDKPTVPELDKCLKDLVKDWKRFALHLPGIGPTDIDVIKEDVRDDAVQQKIALYSKWLKVYPDASWDDVVETLEKVDENSIAEQVKKKYLTRMEQSSSTRQPSSGLSTCTKESSVPVLSEIKEVSVQKEVVAELDSLDKTFLNLTFEVKKAVEETEERSGNIKDVIFNVQEARAFRIDSLQSVKTTDELFEAIRPHYNFLNCHLIIRIALFLCGIVADKATEYEKDIMKFMKTTKIRYLKGVLQRHYQEQKFSTRQIFDDHRQFKIVHIKVENGWGDQRLWLVRNLIETLFPLKHPDELPWFDIVPGSIVMTFIALEHMVPFLIESSRKKTEFMNSMGVISLTIGGRLLWTRSSFGITLMETDDLINSDALIEDELALPFEDCCLIRATIANQIEAVQLIVLEFTNVNVNVKGTASESLHIMPVPKYEDEVQDTLMSFRATYSTLIHDIEQVTLIHDIEQVKQYMKPSSGDPDYEFPNTHRLSEILPRLPKPLAPRVDHYIQSLHQRFKQLPIVFIKKFPKYFLTPFPGSIEVVITPSLNWWGNRSIRHLEQLGRLIFTPTLFHQLHWYRVEKQALTIKACLLADGRIANSLKESATNHESHASILGVMSIQVDDDTVMVAKDYYCTLNLSVAMQLAKDTGYDEVSNLLQQIYRSMQSVELGRNSYTGLTLGDENSNHRFIPDPDSTPLIFACCNDNSQLVQLLLDHNADPNIQNGRGATALMYSTGNSKIFQVLLDCGAKSENIVSIYNESLIHFACMAGNLRVVRKVLKSESAMLNNKNSITGDTPLILATSRNHVPVVKALLEAGADPDIQNIEGSTALMEASINGYEEIVELLLQAKADPDIQNNELETAVYLTKNDQIVDRLVKANADLSIYPALLRDTFFSDTDDSADSEEGSVEKIDDDKTHSGDEEEDSMDDEEDSTQSMDDETYEEFQQAVKKASSESDKLNISLWSAINDGNVAVAKALLDKNTNPNISIKGITPLATAIGKGYVELVEKLLEAHADPNVQDEEGSTPLMIACGDGKYEDESIKIRSHKLIQILLKAKSDPNKQDNSGKTPLMIACSNDDVDVVSMLLEAGADPTIVDEQGHTALDCTADDAILDMLLLHLPTAD